MQQNGKPGCLKKLPFHFPHNKSLVQKVFNLSFIDSYLSAQKNQNKWKSPWIHNELILAQPAPVAIVSITHQEANLLVLLSHLRFSIKRDLKNLKFQADALPA